MAKKNYNELADNIIEKVGGTGNVNTLTHCVTRLRFKLKDENAANTDELISYAKTVIPMLLIAFVMSYVEKFTYKVLPTAIKSTFAPLITVFVMVPLSLFIFGPMGYMVGSAIVNVILWIYGVSPFLIVPLSAISWPILVMFGAHTLLVPTMTDLVATMGFDAAIKPGAYCSNFAELGVLLGVAFRSKKMRDTALSAASSCLFGITEPAMYGVILPLKKTMFSMIGASAIGGAVAGFFGVKAFVPTANSILSLVMFGNTIVYAAIATAISVVAGFILTLVIGFNDKQI